MVNVLVTFLLTVDVAVEDVLYVIPQLTLNVMSVNAPKVNEPLALVFVGCVAINL